jgi:hypothetical protein
MKILLTCLTLSIASVALYADAPAPNGDKIIVQDVSTMDRQMLQDVLNVNEKNGYRVKAGVGNYLILERP